MEKRLCLQPFSSVSMKYSFALQFTQMQQHHHEEISRVQSRGKADSEGNVRGHFGSKVDDAYYEELVGANGYHYYRNDQQPNKSDLESCRPILCRTFRYSAAAKAC